jgi:CRP/FNR family transcriptional regulator, cyclic AMP receptor protein
VTATLGDTLARSWIFEGLTQVELDRVRALAQQRVYAPRTDIVVKGAPASEFFILLRGRAKVTTSDGEGADAVMNVMGPGEVFGEIAILDGQPRSATVTALDECELALVEKLAFQDLLTSSPSIALKLLAVLAGRMRELTTRLEDRSFLDVPARLAKQLLWLTNRYGTPHGAAVRIDLGLSQQELGELVGTTRKNIAKYLQEWARGGVLSQESEYLDIFDLVALRKIAEQ